MTGSVGQVANLPGQISNLPHDIDFLTLNRHSTKSGDESPHSKSEQACIVGRIG